ncbi:MAG: UDP-N-acetylmuramoyl-L-alanyl-D-glutamate--2,6-diaminopimelate ligase [Actinomycetes bacterium]
MNLERLVAALGPAEVVNAASVEIRDLAYDTRAVTRGSLFFCVRGAHADGHAFARTVAAAGAAALVVDHPLDVDLPQIVVTDVRAAMPAAATVFFDSPTEKLAVVGVTGTNGKTTTAFLLHAIFTAAGRKAGLLTNITRLVGGASRATGLNTPEAIDLQRLFREMSDAGDEICVMEATSVAQTHGRLTGTRFAVVVFTNLTQDHLDFHGTMEQYFAAKRAIVAQAEVAVINVGDPFGRRLAEEFPAAVTFDDASTALDGIDLKLRGRFNAANATGAALAARALGIEDAAIRAGIESVSGVPGRFETIDEGQRFAVVVDYAHTPDSLENVLRTACELGEGRLIVVFGAGGDRDRSKRPVMGRVVSELADRAILTSDNPRSEEPAAIAADVADGSLGSFEIELDRRVAIETALREAAPGDVVVIAGRGAEPEQELASGKIPFDDRAVAREILRRRGVS